MKKEIKKINIKDKELEILIEKTVRNFYIHTGRSPFKLKNFHGHIAKLVSDSYGDSYIVHSMGFGDSKEFVTEGSIYHKKADITVVNKYTSKVVAVYNIKFPFSSLSNNANNYFESSVGESTNFRLSDIKVFNLFFYFEDYTSNPKELKANRKNSEEMFRPFLDENSKDLFDLNFIYKIRKRRRNKKMNPVFDLKHDEIKVERLNILEEFISNSTLAKDIEKTRKEATHISPLSGDDLNLYLAIERKTNKKYVGVNRSGLWPIRSAFRKTIGDAKADIEVVLLERIKKEEEKEKLDFYIEKFDTIESGYNVKTWTNTALNTMDNENIFEILMKSKEPWLVTIKKLNIGYKRALRILQKFGNVDYYELRNYEKKYKELLKKTDDLTKRILEQIEREKISRKLEILRSTITRRDYEIFKFRLNITEEKQEILLTCEEVFGLTSERIRQICEIIEFELEEINLKPEEKFTNPVIDKLEKELVEVFIKKESVKTKEKETIESGLSFFESSFLS